jgi:hypothetical protein
MLAPIYLLFCSKQLFVNKVKGLEVKAPDCNLEDLCLKLAAGKNTRPDPENN